MRFLERSYPYIVALIISVFIYFMGWDLSDINNFNSILTATVTFSSIIIAFLSTMVSIFISLTNTSIMRKINQKGGNALLTSYIAETVIGGLALVIYSMFLFMFIKYPGNLSNIMLVIYVFLLTFVLFSAYRILKLTSDVLKSVLQETTNNDYENTVSKPSINEPLEQTDE